MSRWSAPTLMPLSGAAKSAGGVSANYNEKVFFHYSTRDKYGDPAGQYSVYIKGPS